MASTIDGRTRTLNESHPAPKTVSGVAIGQYLIRRLQEYGVENMFGLPGDYVLGFYCQLESSPINVVTCTREDNAGFAADAYARITGLGVVCITYCVGGLSCCNSIAGAYAEKSPVLVISGSPGVSERPRNFLLHHSVGEYTTQHEIYRKLCVATADLSDPSIAFQEIDRVLEAVVRHKRPGYLELPRDLVNVVPPQPYTRKPHEVKSEPDALAEAVSESVRRVSQAIRPVIIAGVEIHRFNLQDDVRQLAEAANIPFVTTAQGKSVISEMHPLYAGLYEGAMGRKDVTRFVEESDCILLLGDQMHDINSGIFTARIDPLKVIHATSERLRISHHHYHDVLLGDFIQSLAKAGLRCPERLVPEKTKPDHPPVAADEPIRIARLVEMLNGALDEHTCVIADVGDSLFASLDLTVHRQTKFLSSAFYTSMGFAVPAALGVQTADASLRPLVLVGDGAFQMTGNELSTIVRHGHNPIIILLDNQGYGTERFLHEGEWKFNDIHGWRYSMIPELLGRGAGYEIRTDGEFATALKSAIEDKSQMHLIQVHIDKDDTSVSLRRLAERLIPKQQENQE